MFNYEVVATEKCLRMMKEEFTSRLDPQYVVFKHCQTTLADGTWAWKRDKQNQYTNKRYIFSFSNKEDVLILTLAFNSLFLFKEVSDGS